MIKKLRIIFIILIFFISSINITLAATDAQIQAGNKLRILKILTGYEDGSLRLDNNISRAEIATILIRILGYEDTVIVGLEEYTFNDVKENHWAYENIKKAAKLGLIAGYPDGSFKPNESITYAEIIAMMIRLTKQDKDLEGEWPYNYINKGIELGIIKEGNEDFNKKVTRGEVSEILWNTLILKL
ncbi:S-layer homology domain-containing protein [Defluviitalea phaphyphila]|uniref:S-layer homology domain-containing protein n=1 Tax=Defluviitalea phaphyphila TaxID=1473580 RepID=UPI00072FCCD9|nr:S-layer homology domain-containing protein [Defluviitalea phaphyphila]